MRSGKCGSDFLLPLSVPFNIRRSPRVKEQVRAAADNMCGKLGGTTVLSVPLSGGEKDFFIGG